jgi:hypothetical protein
MGIIMLIAVIGIALCVGYLASHNWLEEVNTYPLPKPMWVITPAASFEEVVWVRPDNMVFEDDPSSLTRALHHQAEERGVMFPTAVVDHYEGFTRCEDCGQWHHPTLGKCNPIDLMDWDW